MWESTKSFILTWFPVIFAGLIVLFLWRMMRMLPRTKPIEIKPDSKGSIAWDEVAGADEARTEGSIEADLPHGTETLLVVEDNAEVRGTAVEILTSLGYRVHEAANGHQALERFMRHPDIALVFTDVMLPGGLLGTQLVEKLTERCVGLKVLLTSGFSDSRTRAWRAIWRGVCEMK